MARQRRTTSSEDDRAQALLRLRQARAAEAKAKKEAEDLREELLPYVEDLGTVLLLDEETGEKLVAYYSDSEMTILDIDELSDCVDEGLVKESVLEYVAPRKADGDALQHALQAGRIPKEAIKRCITIEHARKTIRFKKEGED